MSKLEQLFRPDQLYLDALAQRLHSRWAGKRLHQVERLDERVLALSVREGRSERPELVFAIWPGRALLFVAGRPLTLPFSKRSPDRSFGPPLAGARILALRSRPGARCLELDCESRTVGPLTLELFLAGQTTGALLRAGELELAALGSRPNPGADGEGAERGAAPPLLVREASFRAKSGGNEEDLLEQLSRAARASSSGFVHAPAGQRPVWSPLPLQHLGKATPAPDPALAGEQLCSEALLHELFLQTRTKLLREMRRDSKRLRRRLERLAEDSRRAARSAELRRRGTAILASLHELERGMKSAWIVDPHSGEEMEIELDPALSPAANADELFRRARKAADSKAHVERRLKQTRAELAALERREEQAEAAREPADLAPLGVTAPARQESSKAKKQSPRDRLREDDPRWRRYVLPGDWVVLAARNARDNDLLTQRVAHMSDFWFHARGCPGSHVVLRCAGRKDQPPKEILEATAAIAAYHSKARNSNLVPVAYAPKRYVRKPKGAATGLVIMNREVVTFVHPRLPEGYRH